MSETAEPKTGNQNDAVLTGHDYDGIQEFDNPLPRWWLATFYGAIVFSVVYFGYYVMGPGPTLFESFDKELKEREVAQFSRKKSDQGPDEAALVAAFENSDRKRLGKAIFDAKCASCHGPQGQGSIGPNLADRYWLHGNKLAQIAGTVANGVLDRGMPPWKALLSQEELLNVVAYVKSLEGTQPPNPKAPQGEPVTVPVPVKD